MALLIGNVFVPLFGCQLPFFSPHPFQKSRHGVAAHISDEQLANADREGLESFLEAYRDARVLVNHGDRCEAFAADLREEGFAASAPALGERIEV